MVKLFNRYWMEMGIVLLVSVVLWTILKPIQVNVEQVRSRQQQQSERLKGWYYFASPTAPPIVSAQLKALGARPAAGKHPVDIWVIKRSKPIEDGTDLIIRYRLMEERVKSSNIEGTLTAIIETICAVRMLEDEEKSQDKEREETRLKLRRARSGPEENKRGRWRLAGGLFHIAKTTV